MGLNQDHYKTEDHQHPAETPQGKNYEHTIGGHEHPATALPEKSHSHDGQADHHKNQASNTKESAKDDCCKDEVAKFEQSDKRTLQPFNYSFKPLFITVRLTSVVNMDVLAYNIHTPGNKYFIRNHHPPIANTRIAIQSFLI